MRIATYNVEWFDALFDDEGRLINDGSWSKRRDVTKAEQTEALGAVFKAMDADAVLVVEAPDSSRRRSSVTALGNFADHFGLRTNAVLTGFANDTQQEISLLFDPKVLDAEHDPKGEQTGKHGSANAPRFDSVFRIDLNVDAAPDQIVFSKPPLEAALTTKTGKEIRLIGVHAKSKAPHGARGAAEVMRVSIDNRRKQLAQCIWIRQRVEQHLAAGDHLIVAGDFNDGPGLDEYEKLFGRSGIEIVLGDGEGPRLFDPHARKALSQRLGGSPTTSRFFLRHEGRYLQALLDYIMVSEGLRQMSPKWRIWHPFDDPACFKDNPMCQALLTASDHFPVTLDLAVGS